MAGYVGPDGPKDAKYVIVGEAPGEQEALSRKPFVGPSGKLQWRLAGQAGITRDQCYITNVFKERPPDNWIGFFYADKRKTKVKPEYEHYIHELFYELSQTSANVIVACGATALHALTGNFGIKKWRGSIMPAKEPLQNRKVIATYHPAYLLRSWDDTALTVVDWQRIKRDAEFPELRLPQRSALVLQKLHQVREMFEYLKDVEVIGSDIETTMPGNAAQPYNTLVLSLGFAKDANEGFCIPFVGPHGRIFSYREEALIWQMAGRLYHNPDQRVIFHNGSFDYGIMGRAFGIRPIRVEDTIIMMRTAYPMLPKSLATCASLFTREPYWKDDAKAINNVRNWTQFWEYNCKDATVMYEIYERLLEHLHNKGLYSVYCRDRELNFKPLCEMMMRGLAYDHKGIKDYRHGLEKEMTRKQLQLESLAGRPINTNSPKQLCEFLYDQLELPEQVKYVNGEAKRTADDAALAKLWLQHNLVELQLIREIKKAKTELSRYVDMPIDELTQRIHCQYKPEAYTGRLSSSRSPWGAGTNLQNLPH